MLGFIARNLWVSRKDKKIKIQTIFIIIHFMNTLNILISLITKNRITRSDPLVDKDSPRQNRPLQPSEVVVVSRLPRRTMDSKSNAL